MFKGYRNYYNSLDINSQNAMHTIIAFANFIFFVGMAVVGTAINGRGWDTLFVTTATTVVLGIVLNLIVSAFMPEPIEESSW